LAHIDLSIIRGCIAGDRVSQEKLFNFYSPKMLGVCMWYARNKEEAEEIVLDGFLRVFTYIKNYSGTGSFEGWMRKIMVNAALLKYRSKSKMYLFVEFDLERHDIANHYSLFENVEAKDLMRLVQTLSPACRLVFNLYVLEGFKHREIAELLGISENTSKSNLADARVKLQKMLSPRKRMEIV
jgi:RNA polymerase sigma-70 factor (ECF subfamily)